MYCSKYMKSLHKNGVKLYFCGKPVNPFILRYFLGGRDGLKIGTVYDRRGNLKEVHYSYV